MALWKNKKSGKKTRQPHIDSAARPTAFSYRSSRAQQDRKFDRESNPGSDSRFVRFMKRLPTIAALLAIIVAFGYSMTLSSDAQLVVSGDETLLRDKADYQRSIDDKFKNSFGNHFKFSIDKPALESEIAAQFPELSEVVISTPFFRHRPIVDFKLAEPVLVLESESGNYILDKEGRALFESKNKASSLDISKLPKLVDLTAHQIKLGKPALTAGQVSYVGEVINQTRDKGLTVESMVLRPGGSELYVKFRGLDYQVRFSFDTDARSSVGTYLVTKQRLERDNSAVKDYIDVRVPERAYVR